MSQEPSRSPLHPRIAVIPAAGRGRRLDPIQTPKPLVEVAGKALIVRTLAQLQEAGIERAVVVVGHRGNDVQRALYRHPELSLDVTVVENRAWERGMIESLLCAREHVTGPFVLAMADHVFEPATVADVMAARMGDEEVVCALGDPGIARTRALQAPVNMRVDGDRVRAVGRVLPDAHVVDAGLFLARPRLFAILEAAARRGCNDLCEALHSLAQDGGMTWLDIGERAWFDVDTPSDLILAEMALRRRRRDSVQQAAITDQAHHPDIYAFSTGQPTRTEILVERGFVRDAGRFPLVPVQSSTSPLYVFTDTRVNELYGHAFVEALAGRGYDVRRVVLEEGEGAKSLDNFTRLCDHVLDEGIDERSVLVSLGGGVVCNVAGLLASTLYRGIGLIHVPTTVMAQCDAAISHKQAVNGRRGKNQIGAYYAPRRIVVDTAVLATLEPWRVSDGLAEVIKHALAQDPDFLEFLLAYSGDIRDIDFLERVIRRNIELKCLLVSQDPKEEREGLVLHYGHTVGHAVEYLSGYELGHGQGVAIGMMVAARVARLMGCCDDRMVELHRQVLEKYGLPTRIPEDIEDRAIIEMMRYNKRFLVEGTRFALVGQPGRLCQVEGSFAIPVSNQILAEALRASR